MQPYRAYRCGGSTGYPGPMDLDPCFPFNPRRKNAARAPTWRKQDTRNSFCDAHFLRRRMIRNHLQKQRLFLDAEADLQHSSGVDAEFNSLEAKVAQFVGLCERLRADNHDLRQQLATAKNDAKRLNERIEGAKTKLESLLERLPD